jgi:hypothetical protein
MAQGVFVTDNGMSGHAHRGIFFTLIYKKVCSDIVFQAEGVKFPGLLVIILFAGERT